MRVALLQAVRQQFGFRCGYCSISEIDVGAILTVDHFCPRSKNGSDEFENLVYCCHACNEHKAEYWNPSGVERILHPTGDDISAHYTEQNNFMLLPLTETGRFHIVRLQLNRPALIRYRQTQHEREEDRQNRALVVETLTRVEKVLNQIKIKIDTIH